MPLWVTQILRNRHANLMPDHVVFFVASEVDVSRPSQNPSALNSVFEMHLSFIMVMKSTGAPWWQLEVMRLSRKPRKTYVWVMRNDVYIYISVGKPNRARRKRNMGKTSQLKYTLKLAIKCFAFSFRKLNLLKYQSPDISPLKCSSCKDWKNYLFCYHHS